MKSNHIIFSLVVLATATLTGCVVNNDRTEWSGTGLSYHADIGPNLDGSYTASVEASPNNGRIRGAIALATKDAANYCKAQDKGLKIIEEKTNSHLLVNGVATLRFNCI